MKWIELYFTECHQFVKSSSATSQPTSCNCAVIQGRSRPDLVYGLHIANSKSHWRARCRTPTVRQRHATTCCCVSRSQRQLVFWKIVWSLFIDGLQRMALLSIWTSLKQCCCRRRNAAVVVLIPRSFFSNGWLAHHVCRSDQTSWSYTRHKSELWHSV